MNKIEECEDLLKTWKAAEEVYKTPWMKKRMAYKTEGLEAALEIIKEPSNTQLQSDIATWQNAKFMCMRCGWLLTEGSAGHCPRPD